MLVSAKEMLKAAREGHYCVGQFNINNLEWVKAILETAEESRSPVILGVTDAAAAYMAGYQTVAALVHSADKELHITVPVALHYDHGSYEGCMECIEAGFTSVMFDGSAYPIDKNLKMTKNLVDLCRVKAISLEAEVGSVAGEEDGISGKGECADPQQCRELADLGITMLAAGIGNMHGPYPCNWQGLNFTTLKAVKAVTGDLPLVLHGGSGIPEDMIRKAISLGIAKINVNTECQIAFANGLRSYFEDGKDQEEKGYNAHRILGFAADRMKKEIRYKMELFGSVEKA